MIFTKQELNVILDSLHIYEEHLESGKYFNPKASEDIDPGLEVVKSLLIKINGV